MEEIKLGDLKLNHVRTREALSKFDLTLHIVETEKGLYIGYEYATDLYDEEHIKRISNYYVKFIEHILNNPNAYISEIQILDKTELTQLDKWNDTQHEYPKDKCVHKLFEEVVEDSKDRIAVVYEDQQLTYEILNQSANQLGHYLRKNQVAPETLVGISVPRGLELIIGLLGILKSGGAYVPLDPEYPKDRLEYMLEDAGVNVLLTTTDLKEQFKEYKGKIICLDKKEYINESTANLNIRILSDNLAYVIYTSGSTGKPKGVGVKHSSFINYLLWARVFYVKNETEQVLLHGSSAFDMAITSIYVPLINSQSIDILKGDFSEEEINRSVGRNKKSFVKLTPSHLVLLQSFLGLKLCRLTDSLVVGGEVLTEENIRYWGREFKKIKIYNEYGPTETTVACSAYKLDEKIKYKKDIPIGNPIYNVQIHILDGYLNPVPMGSIGEIYIGGAGLARGYLNSPSITAEKFVPNPFVDNKAVKREENGGSRLYKTGDLGRYLEDGNIEFLGRIDHQIKIRGYRIELGEIESTIQSVEGIKQCVVLAREDIENQKRLVAYYVPDETKNKKENQRKSSIEFVEQWKGIYVSLYKNEKNETGINDFDISGWDSSYTQKAIPSKEMREWVDCTVVRIKTLNPSSILEIGCGTGLLMYPLIGDGRRYIGIDFSSEVIENLKRSVEALSLNDVSLYAAKADEIDKIKMTNGCEVNIDTVVLNSIVQYFPNLEYLEDVLLKSLEILESGKIFIGDVRDYRLINEFHCSVEMYKAEKSGLELDARKLKNLINIGVKKEAELLISPEYFIDLAKRTDKILWVEILPKNGMYENEMNCFRYDVILHVNSKEDITLSSSADILTERDELNWKHINDDTKDIGKLLEGKDIEKTIKGYPNKRTRESYCINKKIYEQEVKSISKEREKVTESTRQIYTLEEIHQIANKNGYIFYPHMSLCGDEANATYDLFFYKMNKLLSEEFLKQSKINNYQRCKKATHISNRFSNNPVMNLQKRVIDVQYLRGKLAEKLPEYMLPAAFIELNEIPLTPNGKIDRKALPIPEGREGLDEYEEPIGVLEEQLASIWKEVLKIEKIGRSDNFFNLGGHSLLATQLISRIRSNKKQKYR
jgi:amino acid adenylation domain-containing protein